MCYTWGERVILVLWMDSWFLGRSWWWERPTKLSKSGSSFGILGDFEEMRFVRSNGQTLWSGSAMGKMAQWYGRWWQSVSFTELMMASDVLFCSVMSPLATRLPANTRRQQTNTALVLLRGGAHNCFLLHFRIKGCRNFQYISTFRGEPSFIRNCNSEACKWMNGVQTKRTNS